MMFGVGALCLMSAVGAHAQVQSPDQQKCLNAMNKDGTAVAKTQGKENVGCVRGAGKGTLTGTAQACLTADAKGKVGKAKGKTSAEVGKSCGTPPNFGFTGGGAVNAGAQQNEVALVADVYGANLDSAIIPCATSKDGCACQAAVSKNVEAVAATKLATFIGCKKAALKAGASSAAALEDCVKTAGTPGSIAADTKGKIAKAVAKLSAAIVKSCDGPGVTSGAFPGSCPSQTGGALATCLDQRVECRVCLAINAMDGLAVDCDLFDDGTTNSSCVPPPPPAGLQGALTATAGRFNYNLMVGLPGADAACNSSFPGTHACTYAELQTAETAGQLAGLKDTANNTVTAFWAIDNSAPVLQQCQDDTPGTGSLLNWEYPTAHTASRGEKVNLSNPTGTLGGLMMGLQCNFSTAWVGCCG
jgi:hypothetical protein